MTLDPISWNAGQRVLAGICGILVFILMYKVIFPKPKDWGFDEDYEITNEYTGGKPMKSKEYYAKIKSGEILLPKSNNKGS